MEIYFTVACKYNETYVNTTRQEAVLNWAENVGEWADCFPFFLALCALVSCCISALAACVSLYVRPTVIYKTAGSIKKRVLLEGIRYLVFATSTG